jgi:hypothetical protein
LVYAKTDHKVYKQDSNGIEEEIGTGTGGGQGASLVTSDPVTGEDGQLIYNTVDEQLKVWMGYWRVIGGSASETAGLVYVDEEGETYTTPDGEPYTRID